MTYFARVLESDATFVQRSGVACQSTVFCHVTSKKTTPYLDADQGLGPILPLNRIAHVRLRQQVRVRWNVTRRPGDRDRVSG